MHSRRSCLYAYSRVFIAENAPPTENSVVHSRPSPLHVRMTEAPVYTFLYCIFYTFSVYPFSQTHTHGRQQIKLSLPAVLLSTGNCICLPIRFARIRTLCTRAMRIQLRRDDFVSSMKICFREYSAVYAGNEYIIIIYCTVDYIIIFIVNRET